MNFQDIQNIHVINLDSGTFCSNIEKCLLYILKVKQKEPVFITNNALKSSIYCKDLRKDFKFLSLEKNPLYLQYNNKSYLWFCGCSLQSKVVLSHASNWKELLSYLLLMFFIKKFVYIRHSLYMFLIILFYSEK